MNYGTISAYGGLILDPMIEEADEDIDIAVKYYDHGDEFVVVRTLDGKCYEYGYYINRPGYDMYDVLDSTNWFIRNPERFFTGDSSSVENDLFWRIRRVFCEGNWYRPKICYNKSSAQNQFNFFCEYDLKEAQASTARFDLNDHKSEIKAFLEANGIATEENLKTLENLKLDSRKNGFDGVCAKKEHDGYIYGDNLVWIYARGQMLDPKDVEIDYDQDDWCVETFSMDLSQFDQMKIDLKGRN